MLMMRNVRTGKVIILDPAKIEQVGENEVMEELQEEEYETVKRNEPTNIIGNMVAEHFQNNPPPLAV